MYTIKDIAKAANVSPSTVSLVINNSTKVKLETRKKVWKVIGEYNYIPNQFARSLVTKQKKIIGAFSVSMKRPKRARAFDSVGDTYLLDMIPGIEEEINKTDYSLLLDAVYINEDSYSEIINPDRVDGILVAGGFISDTLADTLVESGIPTVIVGAKHPQFDCVDTDPEMGIYLATRHLIKNGHRDIVFINSSNQSQSFELKQRGFYKAMDESSIPTNKDWVDFSEFSGQAGYDTFASMWEKGIRPTAVVTGYDGISLGVIRYLHEQGVHCPEDVSVVGFEDGLLAEYAIPPLTTIRVYKEQLGLKAIQILLERIKNPDSARMNISITPGLIIRESTKNINDKQ